uniref:RING-type E3 ubiquitin transferase n=1 Tax=Callorhinchus milii TaxID=7868 RepID=A0A4W3GGD1_CALMI
MVDKAREFSLNATQTAVKRQCEKHPEELKMFCETDKKLICSICGDVKKHRGHSFLPIDEAAEIYKDQVKSSLASLTQRKETALQTEAKQRENISKVKVSCVGAEGWVVNVYLVTVCTRCDVSVSLVTVCTRCDISVSLVTVCTLCDVSV